VGLDFAELKGGHFFTPDGDILDEPDDLSWVVLYGCSGISTFAFEPCTEDEIYFALRQWREWRCLGDHKVFYGLFRHGQAYRIAPLYEEFNIGLLEAYDDIEDTEDLFNALCASEAAENKGLVGIL
tara:strand:- start:5029 stop:5406 length:378 start_codon:yes stop_codon:yes gene_type:complete